MPWLIPLIGGAILVVGGIAMLLHARAIKRSDLPPSPDGALDGTLPGRGIFGLPYDPRARAVTLRIGAVRVIVVAGAVTLVSAWHLLTR